MNHYAFFYTHRTWGGLLHAKIKQREPKRSSVAYASVTGCPAIFRTTVLFKEDFRVQSKAAISSWRSAPIGRIIQEERCMGWGGVCLKPWDVTYWYYITSLGKPKKGLNAEDYTVKYLLGWERSSIHLTNCNTINWCRFMHLSTKILLPQIYYLLAVVFVSQFILSSSKIHLTGNASI